MKMAEKKVSFGGTIQAISPTKLKSKLGIKADAKLYGREREEAILLDAYRRMLLYRRQELLIVTGNSGCGKSCLACSLQSLVCRDNKAFVSGKFEQEQGFVDPYEVFISCFSAYIRQFQELVDEKLVLATHKAMQESLGSEAKILTDMMPSLIPLVGNSAQEPTKIYGISAQYRIRYLFCKCLKVLTKVSPLVLVLDDLQWAGTASCELVRSLMNFDDMPLLIIGTHRSFCSETPESARETTLKLANSMSIDMKPFEATFEALSQEINARIQRISLGDLKVDAVTDLLAHLLSRPKDETKPLAAVVIRQTGGNVFHILQFVRLLLNQGVIYKKEYGTSWQWDDAAIAICASSDSIMDLLRGSLQDLPRLVQEVLKISSCMGNEIDESALDLILQTPSGAHLQAAAEEGLLVFYPEYGGYRFAHDWIRSASFELIPDEKRKEVFLRIGRRLWKATKPAVLDKNIAIVVSLLNKGTDLMKDEREHCKVAEMNLKAAEKALAAVSFANASVFFRKGIKLLGSYRWKDPYYELTLALYTGAAETETVNGNYDSVVRYIEEIAANARCIEHKLRAYAAFLTSMSQHDNLLETVKVGVDVLRQVGQRLPDKPTGLALSVELAKTKLALRGRSNSDILSMPLLNDPVKITSLHILSIIFVAAHRAFSLHSVIAACRAIRITMKDGLHESSSLAFANYAMVLSGFNEVDAGHRYGALAVSIAEKLQSRRYLPHVQTSVALSVYHWKVNLKSAFDNLRYASETALELGDIDAATYALTFKAFANLSLGGCFSDVERELDRCIQMVRLHNKNSTAILCLTFQQLCYCFSGKATNPALLEGSILNFKDSLREAQQTSNAILMSALYFCSGELAYAFGEFERANSMLEKIDPPRNHPKALFAVKDVFYKKALVSIQMSRIGVNKRQNTHRAQLQLKTMKQWAKHASQIWQHRVYLLHAEISSLTDWKKTTETDDGISLFYAKAVAFSEKENLWNDAALASERFADYQMACGDRENAIANYRRASSYNRTWGAIAKDEQLTQKIKKLMV